MHLANNKKIYFASISILVRQQQHSLPRKAIRGMAR
jgi:hypothetical protein